MSPIFDVIANLAPGRALDLACGRGRYANWLAERGWDVMAIDWSDDALAEVRTPKLKLDLESGEPLPFGDASFDLVLIIRFLHRPLFDEAERVLKPGGVLITVVNTTGRFAMSPEELEARFEGWERVTPSVSEGPGRTSGAPPTPPGPSLTLGVTERRRPAAGLAVRRPRYP